MLVFHFFSARRPDHLLENGLALMVVENRKVFIDAHGASVLAQNAGAQAMKCGNGHEAGGLARNHLGYRLTASGARKHEKRTMVMKNGFLLAFIELFGKWRNSH